MWGSWVLGVSVCGSGHFCGRWRQVDMVAVAVWGWKWEVWVVVWRKEWGGWHDSNVTMHVRLKTRTRQPSGISVPVSITTNITFL